MLTILRVVNYTKIRCNNILEAKNEFGTILVSINETSKVVYLKIHKADGSNVGFLF